MAFSARTDFADECFVECDINAIFEHHQKSYELGKINWVKVKHQDNPFKKKIGDYITIDYERMDDAYLRSMIGEEIVTVLSALCENRLIRKILVVGLGNKEMVSDAVGVRTAERIMVTSHLFEQHEESEGMGNCACIIPKVMGQTGLESSRIVKGVTDFYKPDLIIAIDALATNSLKRINKAIQISNTGIAPGSGVGNHRLSIDEDSMNVPVISIGVATVTTIGAIMKELIDQHEDYHSEYLDCIVTPRSIDKECEELVDLLAFGLNCFIHPNYEGM